MTWLAVWADPSCPLARTLGGVSANPSMDNVNWGDVALACTRDQFAAAYRHPFLYAQLVPMTAVRPQRTEKLEIGRLVVPRDGGERLGASLLILPVLKVQPTFPSMITVGRTQNNDVVVADRGVSKFHAWFQYKGSLVELADGGSRNGTQVRGQTLQAARPVVVRSGDRVGFAGVEFMFLDAASLWNHLVSALDQWG
jgi:FHA domain